VRHARGVFVVPPTVMHVTKGVSAEIPLRFGAMPEAVLLTLYGPGGGTPGSAGSARAPKRVR
jgi:hypothetical protein